MKTFKQHLEEDLAAVQKANKKKEDSLKRINKEKENSARKIDAEKAKAKREAEATKAQAERERKTEKAKAELEKKRDAQKRESIIPSVVEYIKSDGKRKRCHGGDGRRSENHDCKKVHSDMTHKEWQASMDTPKDETKK